MFLNSLKQYIPEIYLSRKVMRSSGGRLFLYFAVTTRSAPASRRSYLKKNYVCFLLCQLNAMQANVTKSRSNYGKNMLVQICFVPFPSCWLPIFQVPHQSPKSPQTCFETLLEKVFPGKTRQKGKFPFSKTRAFDCQERCPLSSRSLQRFSFLFLTISIPFTARTNCFLYKLVNLFSSGNKRRYPLNFRYLLHASGSTL